MPICGKCSSFRNPVRHATVAEIRACYTEAVARPVLRTPAAPITKEAIAKLFTVDCLWCGLKHELGSETQRRHTLYLGPLSDPRGPESVAFRTDDGETKYIKQGKRPSLDLRLKRLAKNA